MKNEFFGHRAVSERLRNKCQDWYNAPISVVHYAGFSHLIYGDHTFTVSSCKQLDSRNGTFSLLYKNQPIDCMEMYLMVKRLTLQPNA